MTCASVLKTRFERSAAPGIALKRYVVLGLTDNRVSQSHAAQILQIHGEIPHTLNGKRWVHVLVTLMDLQLIYAHYRVEVPVKKIINGAPKSTINLSTLRNPECLDEYVLYGQQLRAEVS